MGTLVTGWQNSLTQTHRFTITPSRMPVVRVSCQLGEYKSLMRKTEARLQKEQSMVIPASNDPSQTTLKLNLGCGMNPLPGFVNVDKFGSPDVKHDLEIFPWPWPDNCVEHVVLKHVLEHLGQTTEVYFAIIQELYRICKNGGQIYITVPHPRHDDFLNDPTHVRVITENGLALFSKTKNRAWVQEKRPNSPLGLFLDVDFEITSANFILTREWQEKLDHKTLSPEAIYDAIQRYNNVVKEIQIILKVRK